MRLVLAALVAVLAVPAWAQPLEVVAGEDLTAWREIQSLRPEGDEAVAAYQWFLATYPTSSLAEVAWARLDDLGALEQTRAAHPELRPTLGQVERSFTLHQAALDRAPTAVVVADLEADGTPRRVSHRAWTTAVVGSTGYAGTPYGALGIRTDRGPVGVVGRVGHGADWYAELGVRLCAPTAALGIEPGIRPGGLLFEASVDTLGTVGGLLGGRVVLDRALWLEAGGGLRLDEQQLQPNVRVELVRPF